MFSNNFSLFFDSKLNNGVIDPAGFLKVTNMVLGADNPNIPVFQELIKDCSGISDADRCEYTFKMLECGNKAAEARGINLAEIVD